MIKLDELKVLADNGTPLVLTIEQTSPQSYKVTAAGRGSFQAKRYGTTSSIANVLASDLRHYPNDVTINGGRIDTTPFPDLAAVRITHSELHSRDFTGSHLATLLTNPSESPDLPHRDTFIAGVLVQTRNPAQAISYLTPGPALFPHWQPLHTATLLPVSLVTTNEFHSLTDTEIEILMDRNRLLPLTEAMASRDNEQIERTIAHANAPPSYHGPIHHYAIAHPTEGHQPFNKGEPIIVHRTPVAIDPEGLTNPEFISLAEALYTADQNLVPVAQEDLPRHIIRDLQVTIKPTPPERPTFCLHTATSIHLHLGLDKEPPNHSVPARLWMTEDTFSNGIQQVSHTPGALSSQYLEECLVRAYWQEENSISRSNEEELLSKLTFDMRCLAKAALGNAAEAYMEQLQDHLNSFHTNVPEPVSECSATFPDGRLTLTYRPRQQGDTHP